MKSGSSDLSSGEGMLAGDLGNLLAPTNPIGSGFSSKCPRRMDPAYGEQLKET